MGLGGMATFMPLLAPELSGVSSGVWKGGGWAEQLLGQTMFARKLPEAQQRTGRRCENLSKKTFFKASDFKIFFSILLTVYCL